MADAGKKICHLMAALGVRKDGYNETTYTWEVGEQTYTYRTRHIQLAVLKKIIMENEACDFKVSVLLTEAAKNSTWLHNGTQEDVKGLKAELASFMETEAPGSNITVQEVSIKDGKNKTEMDGIFRSMVEAIGENEKLYFDFTNGFRSIPILAMTIVNYARQIKNVEVGGLYYGAFEAKDAQGNTPIFDMSYCDSILQWSGAAQAFVTTGSANLIKKVYEEQSRNTESKIQNTVDSLYDLTNCLDTSRGNALNECNSKNSIAKAYGKVENSFSKLQARGKVTSSEQEALNALFEVIRRDTSIFGERIRRKSDRRTCKNTSTGVAAIRWAIKNGLIQQGLTALEETLKTYLLEKYEWNMADGMDGRKAVEIVIYHAPRSVGKHGALDAFKGDKKLNDIRNKDEAVSFAWRIFRDFYEGDANNTVHEIVLQARPIKECRNSINHFGLADGSQVSRRDRGQASNSYEELKASLVEQYNKFIDFLDLECENASGKAFAEWKV